MVSGLLAAASLEAARRPHYGGTLRLDVSGAIGSLDPADVPTDPAEAALKENIVREVFESVAAAGPFRVASWEPMKALTLEANEQFRGGRPYLDRVEIHMGRSPRDQALDFELGRADVVELPVSDLRRAQQQGGHTSQSEPCHVIALAFNGRRADLDRLRQALALTIDRPAIRNVLLQRQGEISGALLPGWLSGYEFLFPAGRDVARAKDLAASAAPLSFAWDSQDALLRSIAERIVVNAAEAGLTLRPTAASQADVRLVALRIASDDAAEALKALGGAAAAGPLKLYEAERALIESRRMVPLFQLPVAYELGSNVHAWTTGPVGNWRLEDVWLEGARP
ncbi:MAG: ABC transporter substrate-binding protein [Bryobacteraceae bacterium]